MIPINQYGDVESCWNNYLGVWAIESLLFTQAVASIQAGVWHLAQRDTGEDMRVTSASRETRPYDLHGNTAIIPIHGPMMKAEPKFGGVGTVKTRRMIREAVDDPDVRTIMLHIDSPGGHVAGTQELADEVWKARESGKDVLAHIEDLGASAAYWVASQTMTITANASAEVGSIGTLAIVEDSSARLNRLGIRVHVISTGAFKGTGATGAALSDDQLAYIRDRVESSQSHFHAAVLRGRSLTPWQMEHVSDGKVHSATQAKTLGLLDEVMSFEQALEQAQRPNHRPLQRIRSITSESSSRVKMSARRLALLRQKQGV